MGNWCAWSKKESNLARKDLGQGMETAIDIRPIRPVRLLEERRWHPLEMAKNPTSVTCTNSCSGCPPQAHLNCSYISTVVRDKQLPEANCSQLWI